MTELLMQNNQEEIKIDDEIKELIKKCCDKVLEYEKCDFDAQVSLSIVSEDEIKELNCEYRNKDAITDVLSFPMMEFDEDNHMIIDEFDYEDGLILLGDIIICAKRAQEQARDFGHSFEREIAFLTVHSMLHLLGYDHEHSYDFEQEMFKRQKEILQELGITRD